MNEGTRGIAYSPPCEEGWLRHQENFGAAHLTAADGVVAYTEIWLVSDHPLLIRMLRGIFLMSRPPLLTRSNNILETACDKNRQAAIRHRRFVIHIRN